MRFFSTLVILITIFIGLTFALLNAAPVTLHYYFGTSVISLSLLLVLCFGFGILMGVILMLWPLFKLRARK